MRRLIIAFSVLTLVFYSLPSHANEPLRRVLILYPNNTVNLAAAMVADAIRKRLAEASSVNIEMYGDFLDLARFSSEAQTQRTIDYLAKKYAETMPHVVLALGADVLRVLVTNRSVLMPNVPIVFCCIAPTTLAEIDRPGDVTGIMSESGLSGTLALAERLQPDAGQLVVIAGAAPFDRRWAQLARWQLAQQEQRFSTRYLVGLPRDALWKEIARLPRDTIVILLSYLQDSAGRNFAAGFADEVAHASGAPVYSPYDHFLGRGIVGGHIDSIESIGTQAADLALDIMSGKDPSTLAPRMSTGLAYRVDARQLERWNLPEKALPPDTIVLFKQPPLWEQHRGSVLAAIAAFVLQSAALLSLLIQRRRRKRAELSLKQSEERLESLQDEERQRIAEDLHDSTAQHLTAIGLNLMRLRDGTASDASTLDALQDMKQSLQEATRELRTFTYLLHPPALQRDGLDRTLQRYVEEFGRRTGLETKIRSNLGQQKLPLPLQRSILRIVQEALANVHRHAAASRVSVHLRLVGKQLHLLISDDGRGIEEISKRRGDPLRVGVGIQGMASRVKQFGGKLDVRSRSTGTTVHAVVPVR